jgi:hypothetical protein
MPDDTSLGEAAWLKINISGGAVQFNNEGEIPSEYLPVNSMTYQGIFGSPSSTTGSDLSTSNVLDNDFFMADSNYTFIVAGKAFLAGQRAIFNGIRWDARLITGSYSGIPPGSVIA